MRATNFWEYLGVLKYIQAKYDVWMDPHRVNGMPNWPKTDEDLWRDFPEDYQYVRSMQRLLNTTKIDFTPEDTITCQTPVD